MFGVNFRLRKSFKGDRQLDYVRLTYYNASSAAPLQTGADECQVPAVLEPGKKWVVFAREVRNRQFVPVMTPVPRTRALIAELKRTVSPKSGEQQFRSRVNVMIITCVFVAIFTDFL
jgi:hypothetical protein